MLQQAESGRKPSSFMPSPHTKFGCFLIICAFTSALMLILNDKAELARPGKVKQVRIIKLLDLGEMKCISCAFS